MKELIKMDLTTNQVQLPNDEVNRKIIKDAIQEAVDSKIRAKAESDLQREIASEIFEKTGFKKKHFNKLVKARYSDGLKREVAEMSDLEAVYEILYDVPKVDVDED